MQGGAKRPLRKVNNIDNNVSFQGKKGAILGATAGIAVVVATGGLAAPLAALGAGYLGIGAAGIAGAAELLQLVVLLEVKLRIKIKVS